MNIEQEIADLKRRLDAGDRGEFAGYTKELIDSFKDFKGKVNELYLDYERRQTVEKRLETNSDVDPRDDHNPDGDSEQHRAVVKMNRILWNHRDDGRLKRGEIDEIVLHNVNLHIEQMSDNCWWIGIYSRDDPEVSWMGNFIAPRKMTFSEQENTGIVWDQDESHEVGA